MRNKHIRRFVHGTIMAVVCGLLCLWIIGGFFAVISHNWLLVGLLSIPLIYVFGWAWEADEYENEYDAEWWDERVTKV